MLLADLAEEVQQQMRTRKHAEMTERQFGAQFAALPLVKPVFCLRAPSLAHYRRVVFPNLPFVS